MISLILKMNKVRNILAGLALILCTVSCMKEKREVTYTNQENKIDQYISKSMYVKNGEETDTLRVVYNGGASRLVLEEGIGEELKRGGTISFYYAGYTFSTGKSSSNLFATNHEETATSAKWQLTDADYKLLTLELIDAELIQGLADGLLGVKSGEHCEILFSGKYAYGKKPYGTVPANSAVLFEIWVEGVSNE